jgi:CBS domain-containing protein
MNITSILKEKGNDVATIHDDVVLSQVIADLAGKKIGALVVLDKALKICGIISERDIVRALAEKGEAALNAPVMEFMTRNVVTCHKDETAHDLMEKMTQGRFRHVPVIEHDKLIGIVSIGDVVRKRIMDAEKEAEMMRSYISSA